MSNTVIKKDLINHLHSTIGLNKTEAKIFVEGFFETILKTLENNESVKLSGFGNFDILNKKERVGRNVKTGESAMISARKVVAFRAGKKLKTNLQITDD